MAGVLAVATRWRCCKVVGVCLANVRFLNAVTLILKPIYFSPTKKINKKKPRNLRIVFFNQQELIIHLKIYSIKITFTQGWCRLRSSCLLLVHVRTENGTNLSESQLTQKKKFVEKCKYSSCLIKNFCQQRVFDPFLFSLQPFVDLYRFLKIHVVCYQKFF